MMQFWKWCCNSPLYSILIASKILVAVIYRRKHFYSYSGIRSIKHILKLSKSFFALFGCNICLHNKISVVNIIIFWWRTSMPQNTILMTGTNAFSTAFERKEIERDQGIRSLHQSIFLYYFYNFYFQYNRQLIFYKQLHKTTSLKLKALNSNPVKQFSSKETWTKNMTTEPPLETSTIPKVYYPRES